MINGDRSKINLFVCVYSTENKRRQNEMDKCLRINKRNQFLNVVPIYNQDRLTYNDFFKIINEASGNDDINIITNSDIYFDSTIELAQHMLYKELYALTRWDLNGNDLTFYNLSYSQDSWIFRGKIEDINAPYELGKMGCDNKIAFEFFNKGYKVLNPSKSIITTHLHESNFRTYDYFDQYDGWTLWIEPHFIFEEPVFNKYMKS